MKITDFSRTNSIINQYMSEMRDKDYQHNRLLFRNNIMRIGELEAYEISKTLSYEEREVHTPLGTAMVSVPADKVVLATMFTFNFVVILFFMLFPSVAASAVTPSPTHLIPITLMRKGRFPSPSRLGYALCKCVCIYYHSTICRKNQQTAVFR